MRDDGGRVAEVLVMDSFDEDGVLYTQEEWDADAHAEWTLSDGELAWRDRPCPDPWTEVEIHRITRDTRGLETKESRTRATIKAQ
jgi:hypothetical protein